MIEPLFASCWSPYHCLAFYEIKFNCLRGRCVTDVRLIGFVHSWETASNWLNYYNNYRMHCGYYLVYPDGTYEEVP